MPGMSANVDIIIDQRENVLAIQERAIQFRPTREIWDSFRLEWDDSFAMTARMRGRMPMGAGGMGHPGMQGRQADAVPRATVWVLEEGVPRQVVIETGITDGSFVQVLSGLEAGQEVITGVNHPSLQAGGQGAAFGGGGGQRMMIRM